MRTKHNSGYVPRDADAATAVRLNGGRLLYSLLDLFSGVSDRVLRSANGILDFSSGLICLSFGLEFGIAGYFSGSLFGRTDGLFHGTFNSIFIHGVYPRVVPRACAASQVKR